MIQTLMNEYRKLDFQLDEAKTTYIAYRDKASQKKLEVDALQKQSAELQHQIGKFMADNGVVEENFGNVTVAPKKLPDLVYVENVDKLPSGFCEEKSTIKLVVDKSKIKEAILNGEKVSGASLIQQRYAIRFKNVKLT